MMRLLEACCNSCMQAPHRCKRIAALQWLRLTEDSAEVKKESSAVTLRSQIQRKESTCLTDNAVRQGNGV